MAADPKRLETLVRELQTAALALPDAITERIAELRDAALSAARAEVGALRSRLADAETRAQEAETAADESGDVAKLAERDLETALADSGRLRIALASAEAEIVRLRADGPRTPARHDAPASQPTPSRPPRVPVAPRPATALPGGTPPAEPPSPDGRIAEAFRAWCGEATPVMGKVEFFAGRVRTALPGARVTAVYRDANSQATPVALSVQGGASPVEHWLVVLDGRHWLLPQPMAAAQFRELAPCFEGTATPATLAAIAPAEVRVVGDRYEVPTPGRVS